MSISIKTRQAYSEIDEFLRLLSEEQRSKVPKKLRELFKEEKDTNYIKQINPEIPIKEQNLKEETLGIIALLNLKYWCQNDLEKERLQKVYSQNEKLYEKELTEKYNAENLFKGHKQTIENTTSINEVTMVEYKDSTLKKIINKIKSIFLKS